MFIWMDCNLQSVQNKKNQVFHFIFIEVFFYCKIPQQQLLKFSFKSPITVMLLISKITKEEWMQKRMKGKADSDERDNVMYVFGGSCC